MIKLSSLNEVLDASQQQQLQESSLAQKAAESAAAPQEYKLSPEAQNIVDEVQAGRERDTIRRRLAIYNDVMMQDTVNRFAGGGGIHIDHSKRGTFTAAASRHGMGVQEFASHVHAHPENYSSAMRRKANFARNAAKWHHAFGGPINQYALGDNITISELPKEFVDAHGNMIVRTPSGNAVPLSEAYSRWGGTHVNINDVPGLTNYLVQQEQPDLATRHEVLNEQDARRARRYQDAVDRGYWNALNIGWMGPATKFVMNGGLGSMLGNAMFGAVESGPFKGFPTTWSEWNTMLNTNPLAFARIHRALMDSDIPDKVASGFNRMGDFIGSLYNGHHSADTHDYTTDGGHFGGAGAGGEWGSDAASVQPQQTTMLDIPAVHYLFDNPAETISGYSNGGFINTYAKGGPKRFNDAASMIEHFEGFRASPYRDGKAYSVGYGQYMYGDGANLDWENLLNGSKKLTKAEAHQQVLRSIDKLKGTLRRTLGDDLYNSLTPGQLMGYLDTGYQRPASMINAAKVHRQRGAQAAASVLGVNGFADRNAARRAAFTGNWGNESGYYSPTSDTSYTQATTGGYFSMPQNGPQVLATFGNEPTQDTFTPWWQQDGQQDENFLAQQAAGAAGGAYDITQFQPSWIAPVQNSGTFPQLFAHGGCLLPYVRSFDEGGPYNNGFMDYYGYSWVPGDRILLSDPYFNQIQAHNPNGTYAVDSNGYYVPASTMKRQWDLYNSAPSMNTPATAVPLSEVEYTMQDKDLAAVNAAKRMFGDNRNIVYDDLWRRGSSSATDILNKLDTLSQNSAYMGLNTNPDYIERLKQNRYKLKPDGTLRAQYDTENNVATIEPVVGNFFEPYLSEFVHDYQYNNNIPGLSLIGYNPRAVTRDRTAVDASYKDPESVEYKAHYVLQPVMNQYLNTPSMSYADFVTALKAAQTPNYTKR